MKRYDFDKRLDKGRYAIKWNYDLIQREENGKVPEDFIPMWVADMDFACPPHIVEAIERQASLGIYGYCEPMAPLQQAVCWWMQARFHWAVQPQWISVLPSVVAALNVAVRTLTAEGEGVIIQTPVYAPFSGVVKRAGRRLVENPLLDVNGHYEMDFDLLEKQAADPSTKVLLLCSPHNPVGRVWREEELRQLADICLAHHVTVISDEIHADIVYPGYVHRPLLSLSEAYQQCFIHLTAPSKTFNVPGLTTSVAVIANAQLKQAFDAMQQALSLCCYNVFGLEGLTAAYSPDSEPWLLELLRYLLENVCQLEQFLKEHLPLITMQRPEGTFLCWLDCAQLGLSDGILKEKLVTEAGIICSAGPWFGQGGAQHIRLNIGCTHETLQNACDRLAEAFQQKQK